MASAWGSLARDTMCCHLPKVLSKPGEPGAFVGSRSVGGTGAFTRASYRYLNPANPAPAAITAATVIQAIRDRGRRLVRPPPRRRPAGAAWWAGGNPRVGVRPAAPGEPAGPRVGWAPLPGPVRRCGPVGDCGPVPGP